MQCTRKSSFSFQCMPPHSLEMLNDHHPIHPVPAIVLQSPHLLQMPDDRHIRIHEPIHAVAHARFLAAVEGAGGDFRCDAFAEADVCEAVDC